VKNIVALSILAAALLLTPAIAVGQMTCMSSGGHYDEVTNTVHGYVDMGTDYYAYSRSFMNNPG
jgi:hypothetical protein